jgi:hypothetical protein
MVGMSRLVIALFVGGTLGLLYRMSLPQPLFPPKPIARPAGMVVAPDPPVQKNLHSAPTISYQDAQLQPLAEYSFEARLLFITWYSDRGAKYSPVDLSITWGMMSDSANLDLLEWSASSRFVNYRWPDQPPIPIAEIKPRVANVHILPATPDLITRIAKLRPGNRVRARGMLVNLRGPNFMWNTSTSREDDGDGACELLYLTEISSD